MSYNCNMFLNKKLSKTSNLNGFEIQCKELLVQKCQWPANCFLEVLLLALLLFFSFIFLVNFLRWDEGGRIPKEI